MTRTRLPRFALLILMSAWLSVACDDEPSTDDGDESDATATTESDADTTFAPDGSDAGDAGSSADTASTTTAGDATAGDATADDGGTTGDVTDDDATTTASDATDASDTFEPPPVVPDINGDGRLDILVIGTSQSIAPGADAFSPVAVAAELQQILAGDPGIDLEVNVVAEDLHRDADVLLGLGQGGMEYTWRHAAHSLMQYYHWPDGLDARWDHLAGRGDVDWDQVVIAADPHIAATLPGYHALGVNTVASKVAEGGGQPLLLMLWSTDAEAHDRYAEVAERVSAGARVWLPSVPAARAWEAVPSSKQDTAAVHPTPNGAYVAAAAVYAHLYSRSAAVSEYVYDDELADVAHGVVDQAGTPDIDGGRTSVSPFVGCEIPERVLGYLHTGTSSERGILAGLQWVAGKARVQLQARDTAPIDFNFGRANTNFEPDKRYQIDPSRFTCSLGFPMQDNGNHGDTSMRYGLDLRVDADENGTDLGTALYMVREGELPSARAIPIRTLYARLREAIPEQSAYRDAWHMSRDLDKASAAFAYTLLTGHCALDAEPDDPTSSEWRQWVAHKTGYETAWTVMHMRGVAPCFKVLPESVESRSVTPTESAELEVSFAVRPTADVIVTLTTDNDAAVTVSPSTLVFTPDNHDVPQTVSMIGTAGATGEERFVIRATTASGDVSFDGLVDRWAYAVIRP